MTHSKPSYYSYWRQKTRNISRRGLLLLRYAFVLLSVGYISLYIVTNWQGFYEVLADAFTNDDILWALPLLVGCYFSSWLIVSTQYYMPLRRHCQDVNFTENLSLTVLGALLNYTPYKAGVIYRLNYMKSRHAFSYARFAGLQLVRLFLMLLVAGLIGVLSLAYLVMNSGQTSLLLLLSSISLVIAGASPVFVLWLLPSKVMEHRYLRDIFFMLNDMRRYPTEASVFVLLIFIQVVVLVLQYHLIFLISGIETQLVAILLLIPVIMILGVISLSPGNIGFREMFIVAVFTLTGSSFESGVLVGVIDRAVIFLSTLLFGVLSFFYLELILRRQTVQDG